MGTYQPICNFLDVGRGTSIAMAPERPDVESKFCGGCKSNARIFNLNLSDLSVKELRKVKMMPVCDCSPLIHTHVTGAVPDHTGW